VSGTYREQPMDLVYAPPRGKSMSELPTRREIFLEATDELSAAYRSLGDAADWLRSDWRPVGASLTSAQADARSEMFDAIGAAKTAINRAKDSAARALDEQS
jgi:hypothetical protein